MPALPVRAWAVLPKFQAKDGFRLRLRCAVSNGAWPAWGACRT